MTVAVTIPLVGSSFKSRTWKITSHLDGGPFVAQVPSGHARAREIGKESEKARDRESERENRANNLPG